MIVNYDNATIEIKFRQPMEVVKIENVMNISTENGYMVIKTRNNKKYVFSEIYVLSITQLDENNKQDKTNDTKEEVMAILKARELQRRRIDELVQKLNGHQLNKIENLLKDEVNTICLSH
jgi:hypothetical protein